MDVETFLPGDFLAVWERQKALLAARIAGDIPDTLLIGEHESVITLGRGSHAENVLNPTVPVVAVERGGDVTYHGPGQLVAYPILQLPVGRRDLHRYLRDLETVVIETLAAFDLTGFRQPGWTGVWVNSPESSEPRKIASIGVAVRQWTTYHGVALNVCTNLTQFNQINPCGLQSQIMTTMQQEKPDTIISVDVVQAAFLNALNTMFTTML